MKSKKEDKLILVITCINLILSVILALLRRGQVLNALADDKKVCVIMRSKK